MAPSLQLLGRPEARLAGSGPVPLRGHKAWGLLAYLALHPGRLSRQHLAALLFAEAEDPLAALRWNLSQLRRGLAIEGLRGELIEFPAEWRSGLDVEQLARGAWPQALSLPGLGRELLEGLDFSSSPSFACWLQAERRRMDALARAVLREAALARLAAGEAAAASVLAARLTAMDPLDENHQVLLVRCLAAAGDGIGAARQVAACRELFMRELGLAPGPALAQALATDATRPTQRPATGRAGALAQIEAGEAAIAAGVLEAGLQCLRRAIGDADGTGDPLLRTRARVALGGALVHAARGRDEEGAAALHEALAIGREAVPALAAAACRELGYVEFLRGRYERALAWLAQAEPYAQGDLSEQARIATLHGSVLSDTAYYARALQCLEAAEAMAEEGGDRRQWIYAASMRGRALLLCGDLGAAAPVLEAAVAHARRDWTAFLPWPESFRAEIDLRRGRIDLAAERFEHAFALGCQLGDPCWEGIAGRGLGLVAMARGEGQRATTILVDTLARCVRLPDAYLWGKAHVLDALCAVAAAQRLPGLGAWIDTWLALAASTGMREMVVRAHRQRAALGHADSAAAAALLAVEIDNPALVVPDADGA
jgi:DNA-binding SARP family transcriptional activator